MWPQDQPIAISPAQNDFPAGINGEVIDERTNLQEEAFNPVAFIDGCSRSQRSYPPLKVRPYKSFRDQRLHGVLNSLNWDKHGVLASFSASKSNDYAIVTSSHGCEEKPC